MPTKHRPLLLALLATPLFVVLSTASPATAAHRAQDPKPATEKPSPKKQGAGDAVAELKERRAKLAPDDADGHVELAKWAEEAGLEKESTEILKEVLRLAPDHAAARELLGFVRKDGKWIQASEAERAARAKEAAEARKKGLVAFEGSWVTKEDLPNLKKGLVKVDGEWLTKEEKGRLDAGWKRQDFAWVSPEELPQLEKGLYKVGDKWLSEAEADQVHSSWDTPWIVPTKHFVISATVPRKEIERLAAFAEAAWEELSRLTGLHPERRHNLRLFASIDEANEYGQEYAADHSSIWPGYVAPEDPEAPAVALYDGVAGKGFSHLFVAHAAAHKFLHDAVPEPGSLPDWFVEGLATYVDRYLTVEMRNWATQSLKTRGGLGKLGKTIERFTLSVDDRSESEKRLFEVGLLFAYFAGFPEKADADRFEKAMKSLADPRKRKDLIQKLVDRADELEKNVKRFGNLDR